MHILKADTTVDIRVGPFVDATDGVTPETGITTLTTADQAELLEHNGAATTDISGNTIAAVTGCDGWYDLTLTNTQLDTEGMVTVVIQDASVHLPVFKDFMVVNANVYDALYAAATTDYLQVDTVQISSDTTAADNLEEGATGLVLSSCTSGSTTTEIHTNLTEVTNDHYNGRIITFTSGALLGQSTDITDYDGTTKYLTVTALTEAPSNTDTFVIS